MQNPRDVLAQAAKGHVEELSDELQVSLSRMYELLGPDNAYQKAWRILRPLGRLNSDGLRQIQADFNARCELLLVTGEQPLTTAAQLHKELSEAVAARLEGRSLTDQARELREAIAICQTRLAEIEA